MSLRLAFAALRCAAAAAPLSLLWDYSWENTIGLDTFSSPPHLASYLAILLAAGAALWLALRRPSSPAWIVVWGAGAFLTAVLFDRWWQAAYGLGAGLWHPPQLLKAVAFFAVVGGAWMVAPGSAIGAGSVLALITAVTLPGTFANRQHGAPFYQIACGAYPLVLVAAAVAGSRRFSATMAAAVYLLLIAALVWLLPLFPATPQTGPIFNPRDHLLPPPFPLLLVGPAFVLDLLLRVRPGATRRFDTVGRAVEAGLAFCLVFVAVQWFFAGFLLSPAADHPFFAGGGRHWPFFLEIHESARTAFWPVPGEEFTPLRALGALGLAVGSAFGGLGLGRFLQTQRA